MENERGQILVVEDDLAIRRGLVDAMRFSGFEVSETASGEEACRLAAGQSLDLVLLDWVLPDLSGIQVLREIRTHKPTLPVIMLTARGVEEDRVQGLRTGADDYVVKPFSVNELLARIEAVLRRSPRRKEASEGIRIGNGLLDINRLEFCREGAEPIALSERECDLLRYLSENAERVIGRDELLECVWGLDPRGLSTRTVDMHVVRIREKLEVHPAQPEILLTVRGKGYKLVMSESAGATNSAVSSESSASESAS